MDAVGNRMEVLLDGGVVEARTWSAPSPSERGPSWSAVRTSTVWDGRAGGCPAALEILASEVDHALALTGVPRVADLDRASSAARRPLSIP